MNIMKFCVLLLACMVTEVTAATWKSLLFNFLSAVQIVSIFFSQEWVLISSDFYPYIL